MLRREKRRGGEESQFIKTKKIKVLKKKNKRELSNKQSFSMSSQVERF
jgi:hypothetical protein